jgi:hypothetical protein
VFAKLDSDEAARLADKGRIYIYCQVGERMNKKRGTHRRTRHTFVRDVSGKSMATSAEPPEAASDSLLFSRVPLG